MLQTGRLLIRLFLQKQSDLRLACLSRPFWQATVDQNFRTFTIHIKITIFGLLQQTSCLVVDLITVGYFAFLFNCKPGGWTSDLKTYLLIRWKGPEALAVVRPTGVYLLDFFCSGIRY